MLRIKVFLGENRVAHSLSSGPEHVQSGANWQMFSVRVPSWLHILKGSIDHVGNDHSQTHSRIGAIGHPGQRVTVGFEKMVDLTDPLQVRGSDQ